MIIKSWTIRALTITLFCHLCVGWSPNHF
jgi:hypothetical protein